MSGWRKGTMLASMRHTALAPHADTGSAAGKLPLTAKRLTAAVLALATCLSLTPSEASAAIAFVQTIGTIGSGSTGTTLTVTVPAGGVAATDTVFVSVSIDPSAGTVSCTDSGGNTYTVDVDVQNGSGTSGVRTILLSSLITTPLNAGDTITVTHPSVDSRAISVSEFSGVSTLDRTASATGSSASLSSGATATTNQADELLFGNIGTEAKKTDPFTPGTGYTGLPRENSGVVGPSSDNVTINPEYRIVAVMASYVADGTAGTHPWAAAIATFRAKAHGNGVVEPGEQCDDGNLVNGDCCDSNGLFEAVGTSCRPSAGVCDLPETCPGVSGTCPAGSKGVAVCRAAAGVCDVAESCDGVGNNCPADVVEASTTVCRAAAGVCDVAENCDGASVNCPADVVEASTTVCRPAAGVCDVAENCTGASVDWRAEGEGAGGRGWGAGAGQRDAGEDGDGGMREGGGV